MHKTHWISLIATTATNIKEKPNHNCCLFTVVELTTSQIALHEHFWVGRQLLSSYFADQLVQQQDRPKTRHHVTLWRVCVHLVEANNFLQQFLEVEAGVLLQPFPQSLLGELQEALLDLHHVNLWSRQWGHQFFTSIQTKSIIQSGAIYAALWTPGTWTG